MLSLQDHAAPMGTALAPDGAARAIARRIGHAHAPPPSALRAAGERLAAAPGATVGRVHSAGRFRDSTAQAALAGVLGDRLAPGLRPDLEWYVCRGAHFHNDAHYGDVMFGVWCVAGAAELVFPRAGVKLEVTPGALAVFDPFEIHGVLAHGETVFDAELYAERAATVFVGFELALDAEVRAAFSIEGAAAGRVIASATRISPRDGSIA